jgi:EmrB/QacA subfamily drug resistance transporter
MQIQQIGTSAVKSPNRQAALLVTTIGAFLTTFMGSAIAIALPAIGDELKMDAILLGWVATAYLLSATMLLVPIGRIADIYGRKRIFTYGIFTYTVTSLLLAISNSATMLISLRVLQGLGGAMIFSTAIAILTSVFPPKERGRVLGINAAVVYGGLSIGPFAGGLLTHYLGWRSVFWINVPLSLLIIALIFWKLRGEWAEAKGEKFDIAGSIIYSLMLLAIMYGLTILPQISGAALILAGALGIIAFIKWENRVKHPVLDISLFRHNTVFALSNLAALMSFSATFAVAFLLSLYLQYIKGLTPETAGLVLLAAPLMQAIFAPFAGRLSDKIEPRTIASAGMGFTVIGLIFFIFLDKTTSLWFIIAGLMILGSALAFFSTPNTNAVMGSVDKKSYGVASAVLSTMRQTGMLLSMGMVMLIFAIYLGRVQITPEYHVPFLKSVNMVFIISAALCFAGIFASLARGKVK